MIVFSIIIMLGVSFLAGIAMEKLFHQQFCFSHAMMMGFLALLAVFQIIAYPLMRLNMSFSILFWVYTMILVLFIAAAVWILVKKEARAAILSNARITCGYIRKEIPLLCITAGLAVYVLIVSCGYPYITSDNSYYLPKAMEILAQNRLGISSGFAWSGVNQTSFPLSVDASTLECWKAYWSCLFCLHPTVFSRNTLTLIAHVVSWCALIQAYRSIARRKNTGSGFAVFLLVYLLLILVDNSVANYASFWQIRYPDQGKSMLTSIIYPALIYGCAQIANCRKGPVPWQKWAMLSLIFTAGVATSIIGVFWPFLCCLTMGVPYLLVERRKDLKKLILPLILTCIPVAVYAGLSYFTILTEQTPYFSLDTQDWSSALAEALNVNRLDVFLLCMLFTLVLGSKTAKLVVAGGCITLFATIANPMFMDIVAKYLTTGNVYWRLFWMVPVYFLPAYVAAELFGYCRIKTRQIAAAIIAAALVLAAGIGILHLGPRGLYQEVNSRLNLPVYGFRSNLYGLYESWCDLGSRLLENAGKERIRVMWLLDSNCHLRQYSERIELIGGCRSEHWQYFDQPLENGAVPPLLLREDFLQDDRENFSDPDWVHEQMTASHIDFFCVRSTSGFANRSVVPSGFELYFENNGTMVYRVLE